MHGVLDRGTSEQQPIATLEAEQRLPTSTGRVLDVLGLIENHILPFDPLEILLVLDDLQVQLVLASTSTAG